MPNLAQYSAPVPLGGSATGGGGTGSYVARWTEAEQWAGRWIDHLGQVAGRSPATLHSYALTLRAWLHWCHEQMVDPLLPAVEDFEAFVGRSRQGGGRGRRSTVRREIVTLRVWYRWLRSRNVVPFLLTNDILVAPEAPRKQPDPIEGDDWVRFWADGNIHYQPPRGGCGCNLGRLTIGVGYCTGLRRGELLGLRGTDVDGDRLRNIDRKGQWQDVLPWTDMCETIGETYPHLMPEWRRLADDFATHAAHVGERRMFWSASTRLNEIMARQATLRGVRHVHPHNLRDSAATLLLRAGVDITLVAELMGHSSIDMTRRYAKVAVSALGTFLAHRRQHTE